ncbi:flagellar protein FlgN [Comamonadaceae bacterium M7527]|nr:flagellar protein FlgN [Comamonadaceae bacterium M7527]
MPEPLAASHATNLADKAAAALARANRLQALLEEEFAALKTQQIDSFEQLQPGKAELLASIGQITGITPDATNAAQHPLSDPAWDAFKDTMAQCRDAHRRNELLIARQLDAIRGTIAALQGASGQASVEVYDRLGKLSRVKRARGYNEA